MATVRSPRRTGRAAGARRARERRTGKSLKLLGAPLITGRFNALDFLVPDAWREEGIGRVFGGRVLEALRRDRKEMVREIFGTRPYHLLPRSERVLNPYRIYQRYLSGARLLFLPLSLAWAAARILLAGAAQLANLVREVMGRDRTPEAELSRASGFDAAARKINRMRKPFFLEAMRLRAAVDVEYLGLRLPGIDGPEDLPDFRDDLDRIGALESERRPLVRLRGAALRDLRRFRNFLDRQGWLGDGLEPLLGRLDPTGALGRCRGEVVRALVTAFVTDHGGLRSMITAPEAVRRFFEKALDRKETWLAGSLDIVSGALRLLGPSGRRRRALFGAYVRRTGELGHLVPRLRRRVLRAFLGAEGETERLLAAALDRALREGKGEDAILEGMRQAAREYPSWTRKVITTRALQAITVLDLEGTRDLIHAAGGYGEE